MFLHQKGTQRVALGAGGSRLASSADVAVLEGTIRKISTPVTLLHVVPPIDMDYPEARTVRENWEHLSDTNSLLGRTLRTTLDEARSKKNLKVDLKIRHGNVIEEILAELKEGDYDLVCMGSLYSAHALRQMYAPNVTAEVAEVIGCPVLTVRYQPEEE
jgi:nucleotide-binding universal stress UspA family protein